MKGLVKKDLMMIKSNLKLIGIMLIIFTIMAITGTSDISFLPAFISVVLFMSTFSYDEYNKWDAYAITFPNGRKNIIKSKYVAALILSITSTVLTTILSIFIGYYNKNLNYEETLSIMLGILFAVIFLQSIIFPMIFKFGIEKGRIILFVGVFGIGVLASSLFKNFKMNIPQNIMMFLEDYWMFIIPIIMISMIFISYKISEKIYLKKEF